MHYKKQLASARLKNVQRVSRPLVDGRKNTHFYHRPSGTRLPAPDDPGFAVAYEAAERQHAAREQENECPSNKIPRRVTAPSIVSEPKVGIPGTMRRDRSPADIAPNAARSAPLMDTLMTAEEVAGRYRGQITLSTLANWRALGRGPAYLKIGKLCLYPSTLLDEWERENLVLCGLTQNHRR